MATAGPLSRCLEAYPDNVNCNPCSYGNNLVRATHFCRTCEDPEPLCENCSTQHVRQKISRHHQISENIKEFPYEQTNTDEDSNLKEITCVPCSTENVQVKATYFCQTCKDPEPLCETCATQHTRQKLTRGHEIVKDIWKYFKLQTMFGDNHQHGKEAECDQCSIENIHVKATHFCKTCADPEPLCDKCAKQHTRQKTCRDHEMCKDVGEFLKFQSKNGVDSKKEENIECEPCLNDEQKITATHFCKTCEDPEPLCEMCAKQHARQKAFRHHELSRNICEFKMHASKKSVDSQQEKHTLCEPCIHDGKKVTAIYFCKTCEDPEALCEICAKQHTRQKAFMEHELCGKIHEFSKHHSSKSVDRSTKLLCELCSTDDEGVEATHFCKTCQDPDPLCGICAKHHLKQKLSKDHKMCADIEQFPYKKQKECENKSIKMICEPCFTDDEHIEATHFCKTCHDPDPLCRTCAKHHIKQKPYRDHEICADIDRFPNKKHRECDKESTKVYCEPCSNYGEYVEATHFCKTCQDPDPLCRICAKHHLKQKLSKDHKICADIEQFPYKEQTECENKSIRMICEPCFTDDEHIEATHFCKTCHDPDPLCGTCAKHHIKQKLYRDHEICADIDQFPDKEHRECADQTEQEDILCGPCLYGNLKNKATHFCKTCDPPEPLCNDCAQQHTRQKLSRDHALCEDIKVLPTIKIDDKTYQEDIFCVTCLYGNQYNRATHFCKTCNVPEPFCKDCAQHHTRQKLSRDHELCDEIRSCSALLRTLMSKCLEKKFGSYDNQSPGKPQPTNIKSDTVSLLWEKSCKSVNQYQIRYKTNKENAKWKFIETDSNENHITVSGLMANTKYIFQVRGIVEDKEGPFGPVNEDIETKKSLAIALLDCSKLQNKSGNLSIHLLPMEENRNARNKSARTRQLIFGNPSLDYHDEKTIMLVGATGSGKSTLVDGIANYIMGVSFEDPFRFTMVTLEEEEKKTHNQAVSQTEWITVYKIYPKEGSRLSYTLNIIDTPGFGDTRGIERDNVIVDQIRQLFSAKGDQGVSYIDAVCFIVKAPDARLTVVQKYIFSSLMSLFGKDIESNICTLITFADGAEPPVLASLNESQLPFGLTFNFNNSALFAENNELLHNTLSSMFWKMGCISFERCFVHISRLRKRSLCQTKNVLDEREQLKTVISIIRPQVIAGLSKLSELRQQLDIFKKYKNEIDDNQNFEYEVEETRQEIINLPKGQHVTNCLQCNVTCHEDCKIADDEKKRECWAIDQDTGNCRICTGKCIWSYHKNTPYIFKYVIETVKKTYAEMKGRYEKAVGYKFRHEKYIEELTYNIDDLFEDIMSMLNEMNRCKTRLKEIALRPDPLSAIEHINLMIQSEETERQQGYFNRIKMLKELKRMALVDQDVESFGQNFRLTREKIMSVTGKTFPKRNHGLAMGNTFQTKIRP